MVKNDNNSLPSLKYSFNCIVSKKIYKYFSWLKNEEISLLLSQQLF